MAIPAQPRLLIKDLSTGRSPILCHKALEEACVTILASGVERVGRRIDDALFAQIKPFLTSGLKKK
jgi:hypothetical protein